LSPGQVVERLLDSLQTVAETLGLDQAIVGLGLGGDDDEAAHRRLGRAPDADRRVVERLGQARQGGASLQPHHGDESGDDAAECRLVDRDGPGPVHVFLLEAFLELNRNIVKGILSDR
jgi:hypothetical protein